MSQPAFLKFHKDLKKDGILIIDSDLVNPSDIKEDIKPCSIPSTQIAQSLGNKIVANVVMLGALIAITGVVTKEDMIKSIKTTLPERVLELNLSAFEKGFEAGKQSLNSQ
jgi:2-oxoglutarate ferredoxin oxidoreductase subunit gamma